MAKLTLAEQTLHQQFSEYGRSAREWMRKCELLLPEIERLSIWRKKRFSSIYEYAAKLAGMSKVRVDESLRIYKKIEDKPSLLAMAERKGLQSVRPVATIATLEDQDFWAEKVAEMSKIALQTYVHDFRLESRSRTESEPVSLQMELESELAKQLEKMKGSGTWNDLMKKLLAERVVPEAVRTKSRPIPAVIQRHVKDRTGGLCAAPNCSRPATSLHHTQRWALENVHDPARLQALCTAHERLAHLGLIENEEEPAEKWRLRKEPDRADPKFYVHTLVSLYRPSG